MKTFKQYFAEDGAAAAAVNAAGSGNVAGIGVGPQGEPGGRKSILSKMLKRKPTNVGAKLST
jgi:hypothetical protein